MRPTIARPLKTPTTRGRLAGNRGRRAGWKPCALLTRAGRVAATLPPVGYVQSERFWDQRARENALYFVDNELDYENPDADSFWQRGEDVVERMLDSVGLSIAPDDVVVDIGCGVGRLTRALAGRAGHVYGIDVSSEMIELARQHNPELDDVEWLHGDGRGLAPLADASVDGCFSHVVFQHIPDPEITLEYIREMGRVLRPGGWALFQVSTDPSVHRPPATLKSRAKTLLRRRDDRAWWGSAVDIDSLRRAATQAGFSIERVLDAGSQYTTVLARRMPVATSAVAIAIVSWNTRELLERCLRSLEPYAERGVAEVWVVDNASGDGSADLVRERFGWVNLIASEENLGFGRAVNAVAQRTATPWIATANADIALRPGSIEALLDAADSDPGAGAIAPRLVVPNGDTQHSVFAFPTIPFSFVLATGAFRLNRWLADRYALPGHWDSERARRVPWAVAAFLLVRRSAWDDVGGFDERQWMYAEDLDLGWRLREAGWATRYEPRAVVDHENGASTKQLFGGELAPHWQRSTYGFLARRRGSAYTWAIASLNLVGALLRYAGAIYRSLRDPSRYAAERGPYGRWVLVHLRALRGRSTLERFR
jgi:N-acetylglucosaminyl-diphospho-decaprenol L-rhamnosyltransferase